MFKFENDKCYRMPGHFGGHPYQPVELCYHDVLNMKFSYKTDENQLSNYIPEGFELLQSVVNITFAQCRGIDWMAGGSYNLIEVSAPVRFNGKRDQIEGSFALVVWENKTIPILGGREETGVSKIFADIEDIKALQDYRFAVASYEGNTFLQMGMTLDAPLDDALMSKFRKSEANGLHWRYIPKVGGPGAELCHPVLYPQRLEAEQGWQGKGEIVWTKLRYEQNPSQAHIIKALAELPVLETLPALMIKGAIYLMPSMARVLE